MKKKFFVIGIIIVVVLTAAWYSFFKNGKEEKIEYRTEKVTRGEIQTVVTATGTLNAVTTVQVGSQVSGTIAKINVDFNDKVKKGQIIAQIDPTFLAASVRDAEASLQRSVAQYNQSQRNYERIKTLLGKELASQADYDAALAEYETNDAARKQAEAQLERAKINLRYATIRSPIDGVVISRAMDIGQTVAASFSAPTLFTIANDLTKMQVQASVDEADIGKVHEAQEVTFTVDAYPDQTFKGTVQQVRLSPKIEQNVVNYTVIIDVPNDDLKLMPGMTATVTILIEKKESVLKVPTLALRFNPPQDQIETTIDSTKQNSGGDTAHADRRGPRRNWFMQQSSNGFNQQLIQQRMAAHGIGRLWVMNEHEKFVPVIVRTGISDGTFTEIVRGRIEEGEEITVSMIAQQQSPAQASPFGQRQRNPGLPRRF